LYFMPELPPPTPAKQVVDALQSQVRCQV
jgi:hypothetical protein